MDFGRDRREREGKEETIDLCGLLLFTHSQHATQRNIFHLASVHVSMCMAFFVRTFWQHLDAHSNVCGHNEAKVILSVKVSYDY